MHLSTKSTWHHNTVPFQSLKLCKISWGSCQHNATSAFTAVGSVYHYLHCKHFDITLTQPVFLVIQEMLSTLHLLKEKEQSEYFNTFRTTHIWQPNFVNKYSRLISGLKTSFRVSWSSTLAVSRTLICNTGSIKINANWHKKGPTVKIN